MIESLHKLVENFSNKKFKDGMLTATIIILLILSSSSLIGNEVVFSWGFGKYQGDFDWHANINETEEVANDLGIIKSSGGDTETMYKVYIESFDNNCIYNMRIIKHDGKTYEGAYCLKDDNTIDNLEKYSVKISDLNQGLDKPIKVKVYRKIVIKWYWILLVSVLGVIYLMKRLSEKKAQKSRSKKAKKKRK